MDLQSGKLYWPTTHPHPKTYPVLQEDIDCDVLIVGGGSSGAQCAHYLADSGLQTVLIDKGRFAAGSTASNTALIQYAGEKMLVPLKNTFGETQAVRHLKLCSKAIDEIEAVSRSLEVNPDFVRRDSLYYASCDEDVLSLQEEHALLKKHGFDVDYWTGAQVAEHFPIRTAAALYYHNDGELNPYKFTLGLLESAHRKGVRMYERTEWTGTRQEQDAVVLYTADRREIRARHVIFSTGYENQTIKPDKNATLSSSYAVVTSPVSDFSTWPGRALIWETARPYIYIRTTPDNRVIIGGLDETTTIAEERDRHLRAKTDGLIAEFNRRFPDIPVQAEFYLGAFYGGTHDGLPIIGKYDEYPRCTFLTAYGDNGLVYSMALARIVRDMLADGSSPDQDLYLSSRLAPVL